MLVHDCDSHVARRVEYDPDTSTLIVDFAKPDAPVAKRYRYFNVPAHHFEAISTIKQRVGKDGKPGSEGSCILREIVGKRGQPGPFKFEKIREGVDA